MTSCLPGVAAGLGLGATKEVFEYNRKNFMYDRNLRREKEFALMDYRIRQAEQWREDVKDLVSLTEKKMHIYLLSLVLLCLITIILWTEGRLIYVYTPEWLMTGYCLSLGGAFMFLLLSIWLGIYSAVSAQSFEVRLRTQLVRLPIPSWNELEACRTYGCQFETAEARQMFRVPFLMGKQEDLVEPACQTEVSNAADPDVEEAQVLAGDLRTQTGDLRFADPWGLERPNDAEELGCALGEKVADQWHIKLSRQVAVQWQTYDAYARVSLTIGVNQMLLALTYFLLGYLLGNDRCRDAASYGVILFLLIAECIFVLDMEIRGIQLICIQTLIAAGPLMSLISMRSWMHGSDIELLTAHVAIPIAFILQSCYLLTMLHLCRGESQANGTRIPVYFRPSLYLDVFSLVKPNVQEPVLSRGEAAEQGVQAAPQAPALAACRYVAGTPSPTCPQEQQPPGFVNDLRWAEAAPNEDQAPEIGNTYTSFQEPAGFLSHDPVQWTTDYEPNGPAELPYAIFRSFMMILAFLWTVASAVFLSRAVTFSRGVHILGYSSLSASPTHDLGTSSILGLSSHGQSAIPSTRFLGLWAAGLLRQWAASHSLQVIPTQWPHSNFMPALLKSSLSCDSSGQHLIVSNKLLAFVAELHDGTVAGQHVAKPSDQKDTALLFKELRCRPLVGEALLDTAITCSEHAGGSDAQCEVFVLYRRGQRVASCTFHPQRHEILDPAVLKTEHVANISDSWLQLLDNGRREMPTSIAVEHASGASDSSGAAQPSGNPILATTSAQVVRLRQSKRGDLVPAEVLLESKRSEKSTTDNIMRVFNSRYAGILDRERQSIILVDRSKGGMEAGKLLLPSSQRVTSFCVGGGQIYMLAGGSRPKITRTKLPSSLSTDLLMQ
mmetsp:Transcript_124720/g.216178  ORF Transcript_124720/g.216178 Transcript_124720/m.216178 type:complete len:891 (+) Transcript_124720:94-2766(+)